MPRIGKTLLPGYGLIVLHACDASMSRPGSAAKADLIPRRARQAEELGLIVASRIEANRTLSLSTSGVVSRNPLASIVRSQFRFPVARAPPGSQHASGLPNAVIERSAWIPMLGTSVKARAYVSSIAPGRSGPTRRFGTTSDAGSAKRKIPAGCPVRDPDHRRRVPGSLRGPAQSCSSHLPIPSTELPKTHEFAKTLSTSERLSCRLLRDP